MRVALEVLDEGAADLGLGPALGRVGDALSEAHRLRLGLKLRRHDAALVLLAVSGRLELVARGAGVELLLACNCGSRPAAELLRERISRPQFDRLQPAREAAPHVGAIALGVSTSKGFHQLPRSGFDRLCAWAGTSLWRQNQILRAHASLKDRREASHSCLQTLLRTRHQIADSNYCAWRQCGSRRAEREAPTPARRRASMPTATTKRWQPSVRPPGAAGAIENPTFARRQRDPSGATPAVPTRCNALRQASPTRRTTRRASSRTIVGGTCARGLAP